MNNTHVELIDPAEKLSPELGGTGYVGPTKPATAMDLYVNALAAVEQFPELNATVWKVLRTSVSGGWRAAPSRRLRVGGHVVPCEVIGGVKHWWFVSVDATKAATILKPIDTPSS
jgi:hypothetical protein